MKIIKLISYLFFTGMFLVGCTFKEEEILWENTGKTSEEGIETMLDTEGIIEETKYQICVDISGAVAEPGVYFLEEGARVYQVVELAGGLLEDADCDTINLAAFLKDGEKIRIYTMEEAAVLQEVQENSGLVNLNTADMQQLCTLSGIGESRAKDIIAYRETHGSFENVEEIMNVNGIKETTFQKIRDKIVVE